MSVSGAGFGPDSLLIGSGLAGSYDNTWDRWVIREGQIPEPSALLGISSLLALGTWRRRRS